MRVTTLLLFLFFISQLTAQSDNVSFILADAEQKGTIDKEFARVLEKDGKLTAEQKISQMAILNEDFYSVFLNRELFKEHNNNYSIEIKTGKVTDQKSTGRCWLYAGLNAVRPMVVERLGDDDFEFSQNYLYFWDKMEKANFFLEKAIARADMDIRDRDYQSILGNPIADGGYWQNFTDLIKKYGCVPANVMPEVKSTESSRSMLRNINYLLKNYAYDIREMKKNGKTNEDLRDKKKEYLLNVYKILSIHLGEPVNEFTYRYYKKDKKGKKNLSEYVKTTPMEFYKKWVEEDVDDFIMFANWPGREYGKLYRCESSNNVIEGTPLNFLNLEMDVLKEITIASLRDSMPVNFSADVGKQMDRKSGVMNADLYPFSKIYGFDYNWNKKRNSMLRNINSTHAMVILGVDMKEGEPLKWKVENSWGTDNGHKGFYAMYDNWMDLYVVRLVIHKKYVSEKIMDLLKQKPVTIPEWQIEQ